MHSKRLKITSDTMSTVLFQSICFGGVTCDQLDEISQPASQHVTWDKPEISDDFLKLSGLGFSFDGGRVLL